MVFSFFKKSSTKMPERPAARPRPVAEAQPEVPLPVAKPDETPEALPEPLPDLEFTRSNIKPSIPAPATQPKVAAAMPPSAARDGAQDFAIDDFDEGDFTESTVMGIDVEHDIDPLQACIEQVVVLYANSQDAAARSLLETFVRSYGGPEGRRFWLLLFDLLQANGDRPAFDKLGIEYAQICETSPPTWREENAVAKQPAAPGPRKVFLQGVLTAEGALPVTELAKCVAQKEPVLVDCSKLIGCDDEIAANLAELLHKARKQRLALSLIGSDAFMKRLNERLIAGDAKSESAWRLLLELLQRFGTQEAFEERAVDYAVTFEHSPPSWEPDSQKGKPPTAAAQPADDAHYLAGELKACRFEELASVLDASPQPVLDFSGVRRLDFVSAGQLANRLSPFKAAGRDIVIRSPNHLVAELMAVVGINKLARIIVPKS